MTTSQRRTQEWPEDSAEAGSQCRRPRTPHHGDRDKGLPQLLTAYEHKERFFHIWDSPTRRDAEKALDTWIDDISQGQTEVWKDLVRAISGWHEEMLTCFETDIPITNGMRADLQHRMTEHGHFSDSA